MTVSVETNEVEYDGDAATSEFDFSFKVFETDDIKVVVNDASADDHELPDTIGGVDYDFTVTGELEKFENGGKVSLLYDNAGSWDPWLLPTDWSVTITLDMAFNQPTDLLYGGCFSSDALEKMVDRATKMIQQLDTRITNLE